jgi:multidrug efflux pump subunit AcrA (membrane-fusion protein)
LVGTGQKRATPMARSLRWFVLLVLAACAGCGNASADAKPSPSPLPPVATAVARKGVIHPTLQIAGVITPYRQVGIAANLAEPITTVTVQEGQQRLEKDSHVGNPGSSEVTTV